jgi:DNA polymerase-3 subunit epsilon
MRQIVLDTETTGLEPDMGHRIIEIGAVEVVNRKLTGRHFHKYLNPERDIDDGAFEVHGLSRAFLTDKPLFADIWEELVAFIRGAELVIHNAPFDVSFLDYEFRNFQSAPKTGEICTIKDSLAIARNKHPGQKNNLDALCRRYFVDNSQRQLHGALLDAEILADVYLLMTGGQTQLFGVADKAGAVGQQADAAQAKKVRHQGLRIVAAAAEEIAAHEHYLDVLAEKGGANPLWRQSEQEADA